MSETTDEAINAMTSSKSAEAISGTPLGSAEWEERLAQARAEREKALAQKKPVKSKTKRKVPAFVRPPVDMSQAIPFSTSRDEKTPFPTPPSSAPQVTENTPSQIAAAPSVEPVARQGVTLLAACAFGIGVGLSLGVLLMAGWSKLTQPAQFALTPATTADAQTAARTQEPAPTLQQDASVVSRSTVAPTPVLTKTPTEITPQFSLVEISALAPSDAIQPLAMIAATNTPVVRTMLASKPRILQNAAAHDVSLSTTSLRPGAVLASIGLPFANIPNPAGAMPVTPTFAENAAVLAPRATPVSFAKDPNQEPQLSANALPVLGLAPRAIDVLTQLQSTRNSAQAGVTTASVDWSGITPASIMIQPDLAAPAPPDSALPFVGPPPERVLTLAEKLGLGMDGAPSVRLFVHAPSSVSDDTLNSTLASYEETGFPIAQVRRENLKITKTHIRYYSPDDTRAARALALSLGIEARDFTRRSTASGRIEIWMEGTRAGRVASTTSAPRSTRTKPVDPAIRLRNSLIQKLRRGDHL